MAQLPTAALRLPGLWASCVSPSITSTATTQGLESPSQPRHSSDLTSGVPACRLLALRCPRRQVLGLPAAPPAQHSSRCPVRVPGAWCWGDGLREEGSPRTLPGASCLLPEARAALLKRPSYTKCLDSVSVARSTLWLLLWLQEASLAGSHHRCCELPPGRPGLGSTHCRVDAVAKGSSHSSSRGEAESPT